MARDVFLHEYFSPSGAIAGSLLLAFISAPSMRGQSAPSSPHEPSVVFLWSQAAWQGVRDSSTTVLETAHAFCCRPVKGNVEIEMGVVRAKIQTVEEIYRLVWTAVASKRPISAIYKKVP